MKKSLKKIVQIALVVAILCPSVSNASGGSKLLKLGGGISAVIGAIGWYANNSKADDCKALRAKRPLDCINLADLESRANGFAGLAVGGIAIFALGSILDNDSGFQVRAIQNGIEIERKGISFSAAATGGMKLQKRWEF